MPAKVHLFVDNSNIYISAKNVARRREGEAARHQIRLDFENMVKLALAGREVGSVAVLGSIPPEERAVWERLEEATGVKPELYERGKVSGEEQGLDQCLQVHMLRAMADSPTEPQVAVLMTGDGKGYDEGVGFHADLERMHQAGWGIEVISWRESCKRTLRDWVTVNGVFIELDEYYNAVTFLKGLRSAQPINLTKRPRVQPRESPTLLAEAKVRKESSKEIAELRREVAALRQAQEKKAQRKAKYARRHRRNKK